MSAEIAEVRRCLMARYCDGDEGAFRELHALLAPRIHGCLIRLADDRALADDLLQQTFLKVHAARAAYIRGADPLPWVYAIARRTFFDHVRKNKRTVVGLHHLVEVANDAGDVAAESPDPRLIHALRDALPQLPEAQRTAVCMTKLDGKTVAQAAHEAGTTVGAMKLRAHRGYLALRRLIARSLSPFLLVAAGVREHTEAKTRSADSHPPLTSCVKLESPT